MPVTRTARMPGRLLVAAGAAALILAACGDSSLGDASGGGDDDGPVKIGLLVPQSGVYTALGEDMKNGFEMYVEQNDGRLGGREVDIVLADEGETADSGQAAANKLIKDDGVLAVTGIVSSAVMNGIRDLVEDEQVPLVGSNASPTNLNDVEYIWRTSYVNDQPGIALGEHVATTVDGPVYLIAADYQAGKDEIEGFKQTFLPAGGEVADEQYTPFPGTTNFQPYLAQIQASGAAAVFCFYAGGAAVDFVKQYDQYGLAGEIDLFAPGFLTEGGVLEGQGDSAAGIYTSMNYNADLDNDVNAEFAEEYAGRYDMEPTTYAMASYDAAAVLDKAIEAAGDDVTRESLNQAIGEVGEIESPRGAWRFNDEGTPVQTWYLRQVADVGGVLKNTTVGELGELGD